MTPAIGELKIAEIAPAAPQPSKRVRFLKSRWNNLAKLDPMALPVTTIGASKPAEPPNPMINMGTRRVVQLSDGWTIVTADKKPSAHFEHDVAVVDGQPDVLSTFEYVEQELKKKNAFIA